MDARPTELIQRYGNAIEATAELGLEETRILYDKAIDEAIESQLYEQARDYSVEWARLEKSLGEIENARICYHYAADYSAPHGDADFWNEWSLFEEEHGNHDTFLKMLRIKSYLETCNVYMERDPIIVYSVFEQ